MNELIEELETLRNDYMNPNLLLDAVIRIVKRYSKEHEDDGK